MRKLLIVLLVVLGLLALLAWKMPASLALGLAGGTLEPLRLDGVSGTLWRGQALDARVLGEPIGRLQWTLAPMALLRGGLDVDFMLDGERYAGSGHLMRRDGRLRFEHTDIELPAATLAPLVDLPSLDLRGRVRLVLDHAELLDGVPVMLSGSALWQEAAVSGAAAASLGEITATFEGSVGKGFRGVLDDNGGPLDVDGGFQAGFTGYSVDVRLKARPGHPQVEQALRYVGQPQADGSVRLLVEGGLLGAAP